VIPLRVGFAVGRSVGSAVQRNRLRRRLRVLVDATSRDVGPRHGWLLIGARPSVNKHTFASLGEEVQALLAKVTAA
jgi:ribonuclease P protein component